MWHLPTRYLCFLLSFSTLNNSHSSDKGVTETLLRSIEINSDKDGAQPSFRE